MIPAAIVQDEPAIFDRFRVLHLLKCWSFRSCARPDCRAYLAYEGVGRADQDLMHRKARDWTCSGLAPVT